MISRALVNMLFVWASSGPPYHIPIPFALRVDSKRREVALHQTTQVHLSSIRDQSDVIMRTDVLDANAFKRSLRR